MESQFNFIAEQTVPPKTVWELTDSINLNGYSLYPQTKGAK